MNVEKNKGRDCNAESYGGYQSHISRAHNIERVRPDLIFNGGDDLENGSSFIEGDGASIYNFSDNFFENEDENARDGIDNQGFCEEDNESQEYEENDEYVDDINVNNEDYDRYKKLSDQMTQYYILSKI